MTLISAPPTARTASTSLPATSTPAEPGVFASVLEGVLQADASACAPVNPDAATGGQDLSASAQAMALLARPTSPSVPNAAGSSAETEVAGAPDASVEAPAIVPGAVLAGTVLGSTVGAGTALSPVTDSAAPVAEAATAAGTAPPAAQVTQATSPGLTPPTPASPSVDDTAPAGAPAGDVARPDAATPATTSSAPIASPAPAASVQAASMQNPPDADSQTPQPTTASGPVAVTPTANGTGGKAPGATTTPATAPVTAANGQAGLPPAASHPAEAPASVRAPALAGSQPAAPEPVAPTPAPAVSAPMPTAPAAPTAVATAPAPAAPPAQPLHTQLAQPLFSLAGARPGEHVMTVQVTPENLGPVTVRAVISADDIRIELFSPSDGGRDALRQILSDLRRDLAGGGLSASLDLSSKDAQDSRDERAPLHQTLRDDSPVPAPVAEQRSTQSATTTSTLDITV